MNYFMKSRAYITQPAVIISIFCVLIWMIDDFSERFMHDYDNKKLLLSDIASEKKYSFGINKEQRQQILALYQPFIDEKQKNKKKSNNNNNSKPKIVASGLSLAHQNKQNGVLKQVFAGDNKLELKAIIINITENSDNDAHLMSALILVSDLKTGKSRIELFENNQAVYGYTLVVDSNIQITLRRNEQKIILKMYGKI